jgi:hypothetical protein
LVAGSNAYVEVEGNRERFVTDQVTFEGRLGLSAGSAVLRKTPPRVLRSTYVVLEYLLGAQRELAPMKIVNRRAPF